MPNLPKTMPCVTAGAALPVACWLCQLPAQQQPGWHHEQLITAFVGLSFRLWWQQELTVEYGEFLDGNTTALKCRKKEKEKSTP